jgi:uncharacterized membrane protein YfcA
VVSGVLAEPATWALIGGVFFLAGLVKGVIGLGMPSMVVGLLSVTVGVKEAIALLVVPSFVTNVWQAVAGSALRMILARTWPMLTMIAVGTWAGALLLSLLDAKVLSVVVGLTLVGYTLMGFLRPTLPHPGRHERLLSLPVGIVHGIIAGMTGSYIPAIPFLQSLGWSKDVLVQALGVVFAFSTIALALALADRRLLSVELLTTSAGALVPALVGMYAGQRVRHRLSEERFRQLLLAGLMALGVYILVRAVAG